jgi:AAA family ATPase
MGHLLMCGAQDEIDAIAASRGTSNSSASEGVLISLLTEMDGAQELRAGVTLVGATNRPEVLVCIHLTLDSRLLLIHAQDVALTRPGRLDRLIYVGPPDAAGREEILGIRTRSMAVEPGLDLAAIAALVRVRTRYRPRQLTVLVD